MKHGTVFVLYHSAGETGGLILGSLHDAQISFVEIKLYAGEPVPDADQVGGLVVMGGPMNVDEERKYPFLAPETRLIRAAIAAGKPVLGICLGSQLIAKALGARVYPNRKREVGWHPITRTAAGTADPLFSALPENLDVLHWHGDTFDLPSGAVHLVSSPNCTHQAFRYGSAVYGLQFHLEATPAMVADWCSSDAEYVKGAGETSDGILQKTPASFQRLEPIARHFFFDYLSLTPVNV